LTVSYSTTPGDGPALIRALHDHQRHQEREARMARYRHRLVTAGAFDPEKLSEQAQRILRWLTEWDDWTVDGVAEMLAATRTAAQVAIHHEAIDRKVEALRASEAATEAALARYDEREAGR
jgi:transposase